MGKGLVVQAKEIFFESRPHFLKKKVRYCGCTNNPRDAWMLWDNPLVHYKDVSTTLIGQGESIGGETKLRKMGKRKGESGARYRENKR